MVYTYWLCPKRPVCLNADNRPVKSIATALSFKIFLAFLFLLKTSSVMRATTVPTTPTLEQNATTRSVQAIALRRAMRLQMLLTVVFAALSGYLAGTHGVVSALLGGAISMVAAAVFSWMLGRHSRVSGSLKLTDTLVTMLKAEAAKIAIIIALLLLTFLVYKEVAALALVATFIITTIVFAAAAFMAPSSTYAKPQ